MEKRIKRELLRKGIHLLIALTPLLASYHRGATVVLLLGGITFYTMSEVLRSKGKTIPLVSSLTAMASRKRDEGHFVIGPVTLGVGALGSLAFFAPPLAAIAIYALAFGDGLSSLAGNWIGGVEVPFTGGKTLIGSLTCFASVLMAGVFLTENTEALLITALGATILEALPCRDYDNILIPIGTGLVARLSGF